MPKKIHPAQNWTGNEVNDFEPSGMRNLDVDEIYKLLGIRNAKSLSISSDPIFQISRALSYYTHQAYPVHKPTYAARLALVRELDEKAKALADVFMHMGEESFLDIENSIRRTFKLPPVEETPLEDQGNEEIQMFREFSAGQLRQFSDLLKIAADEFPNGPDAPSKGRPRKTAVVHLIRELAMIYEDATNCGAYEGFTSDPETGEYDSAFFRFVWEVVSKFDPSEAKTNNALGTQIRNALADSPLEHRITNITEQEGEFFDTGND